MIKLPEDHELTRKYGENQTVTVIAGNPFYTTIGVIDVIVVTVGDYKKRHTLRAGTLQLLSS